MLISGEKLMHNDKFNLSQLVKDFHQFQIFFSFKGIELYMLNNRKTVTPIDEN